MTYKYSRASDPALSMVATRLYAVNLASPYFDRINQQVLWGHVSICLPTGTLAACMK